MKQVLEFSDPRDSYTINNVETYRVWCACTSSIPSIDTLLEENKLAFKMENKFHRRDKA